MAAHGARPAPRGDRRRRARRRPPQGPGATTVRDVAAEMGTSSGLIHHYFDSMDDVLAAAFERVAGEDLASDRASVAEARRSASPRVRRSSGPTRPSDDDWAFQLWLDAWAEAARRPGLQAVSRRLNLPGAALLERTIATGCERGVFRCADPLGAAWRILSLRRRPRAPGRRPRHDGPPRRRPGLDARSRRSGSWVCPAAC